MKEFLIAGLSVGLVLGACEQAPDAPSAKFTEDGKLKVKQKNVWELHMELQEMREHLRKGKLFATLYFLRNQFREKFKK